MFIKTQKFPKFPFLNTIAPCVAKKTCVFIYINVLTVCPLGSYVCVYAFFLCWPPPL